jgi:hypothetical protein
MESLAISGNGYTNLPAMLRISKYTWLMFYLFFKIVIPVYF